MVPLGDEAQVEACFGPFGDSAHLEARLVHRLCRTYLRLQGDAGHVESHFCLFGDSVSFGAT